MTFGRRCCSASSLTLQKPQVFHSIRHWGNQALSDAKVSLEWRRDIMGHGGVAETDERYRDDTRMKNKLVALLKLPKVSAGLEAFPIRLGENVNCELGARRAGDERRLSERTSRRC